MFNDLGVARFQCAPDLCISSGFLSFFDDREVGGKTRNLIQEGLRRMGSASCESGLRNDVFEHYKLGSATTETDKVDPKLEELVATGEMQTRTARRKGVGSFSTHGREMVNIFLSRAKAKKREPPCDSSAAPEFRGKPRISPLRVHEKENMTWIDSVRKRNYTKKESLISRFLYNLGIVLKGGLTGHGPSSEVCARKWSALSSFYTYRWRKRPSFRRNTTWG